MSVSPTPTCTADFMPPAATASPTLDSLLNGMSAMTLTSVAEADAVDGGSNALRIISLAPGDRSRLRLLNDAAIGYPQHDLRIDSIEKPVMCIRHTGDCPLCKISKATYNRLTPAFDLGRRNAWLLRGSCRIIFAKTGEFQLVAKTGSLLDQLKKLALGSTADVLISKVDQYTFSVIRADTDPGLEPPEGAIEALRERVTTQRKQIMLDHIAVLSRDEMLANPEIVRLIEAAAP